MSAPLFPYHRFDEQEFERMCADLMRSHFRLSTTELNGRKGQRQGGVDVITVSPTRIYALQCKCYQDFKAADFKAEIKIFWKNLATWKKLEVSHYVLCIAHELRNTKLLEEWLLASVKAKTEKIEMLLWSARTLQAILAGHPNVARDYIRDPAWLAQILGTDTSQASNSTPAVEHSLKTAERAVFQWLRASPFNGLVSYCAQSAVNNGPITPLFNKIIDVAGKQSARTLPPVEQQLRLAMSLSEATSVSSIWQTRRLLGKAIAAIIRTYLGHGLEKKSIDQFSERCGGSNDAAILLATAFTANRKAPSAFGNAVAKKLLNSTHPQVKWLIARRWPMLKRAFVGDGLSISKNEVFDQKDDWLRRRWLLAFIQELVSAQVAEGELQTAVSDVWKREQGTEPGNKFLRVLQYWIGSETHYNLNLSGENNSPAKIIVDDIHQATLAFGLNDKTISANDVALVMDLACIKIDSESSDSPNDTAWEGRYGTIEKWVKQVLAASPDETLPELVRELASCSDEGIRLAAAKNAGQWIIKIDEAAASAAIIETLLRDENAWVFRDALKILVHHQYALANIQRDKLFDTAKVTLAKMLGAGWPPDEFGAEGQLLLSGLTPKKPKK
jgi:hypothetical protein